MWLLTESPSPQIKPKQQLYLSCSEAKTMTGRQQPEPKAHTGGDSRISAGTQAPFFCSWVESPLVCDSRPFPLPPLISLFPSLPWTLAGLSLSMCHHPQVLSRGVFCWQRPVPPIPCVNRLIHPRLHLNRESPSPWLTRTQRSRGRYHVQGGELENASGVQQGKGCRIRGAHLPGRGRPMDLVGGVVHQGPRRFSGRGR